MATLARMWLFRVLLHKAYISSVCWLRNALAALRRTPKEPSTDASMEPFQHTAERLCT